MIPHVKRRRNPNARMDSTLPTNDEYMGSENSTLDANGTEFRSSHESDDDFSALDLLLLNMFPSQDVGVTEKETPFTTCEVSSVLESNPSTTLGLNVPLNQPTHQFEQLAWDSSKNDLCEDTPLERIERTEFTQDANEVGQSNQVFSSKFRTDRCPGNINEGNWLTERQEAVGNHSPNLAFQLWNSDSNNVSNESYASNSVAQQTGESYNLSTDGECSKTAFTTSDHLLEQSRVVSSEKFVCSQENHQRMFARGSPLATHMQSDDKPYKCDQCPKTFRFNYHLKSHYAMHKKEKTLKCGNCHFVTKWKRSLVRHIKTKHK